MQKLGMKAVPGVSRVTIKKSKNVRIDTLPPSHIAVQRSMTSMVCSWGRKRRGFKIYLVPLTE